jgi:Na+/melibiose symporter-like transporter
VEGFIFLPKLFAPVVTGLWVKSYGFTYPLLAAAMLGCLALLWVLCMVPESLPPDAAVRSVPLDLNPMQTFRNILFIYQHEVKLGQSPLLLISVSFCLYFITYISFGSVLILYCKHVFNWGPDTIGFFDGLDGGVHAGSMFFAPLLVHQVFGREFTLLNWIQVGYVTR